MNKILETTTWEAELDRAVDARFEQVVALRRHLHQHPEPSGKEDQTSLHLYRLLLELGFDVQIGPEGRGAIVEPPHAPPGPKLGLRADIDALKIQDTKTAPYRSRVPSVMHACGHDAHTATLYGALLALLDLQNRNALPWPVRWRGVFQPAEETGLGALEMIKAGVLKNVQGMLALHMDPSRDLGHIGIREGSLTAACDDIHILISGRGGHAARPHESLDPIVAAAQLISTIYLTVPRVVDSHDPVVVTIGQINGGDNANVIPEQVEMLGTLRTLNGPIREKTKDHLQKLARGLEAVSGTTIQITFEAGPPAVQNDLALTSLLRHVGRNLLGDSCVQEIPRPSMGGEDFAYYQDYVPGSMFRLGCRSSAATGHPLHSSLFDIDERALSIGAKIFARAVVTWFDPQRNQLPSAK